MKRMLATFVFLLIALASGAGLDARDAASTGPKTIAAAPGNLRVHVLDVGQGQSILIVSPTGKAVLVDAGPAEAGQRVVNALRRHNVQNIEVAVATQTGANYIGGMRRVASSSDIAIKTFLDSGQPWKTNASQQMLSALTSANATVLTAKRGQFYPLGGGARLDVINPAGDGTWVENTRAGGAGREDANAVILRLLYKDFVMLIMSGAESGTAQQLLDAAQNIWAPVLIVGNHGSRDSTSEKMLSIVQPKIAIISAGANSGSPAPETLERLRQTRAEIYRTDLNGEITIISDGKKHEVTTERKGAQ